MKDFDFQGKKVLVRVDFNVPLDKTYQVTDDTRIRGALPTIKHIVDHGGVAILMSHLGRPMKKLKEDESLDTRAIYFKTCGQSIVRVNRKGSCICKSNDWRFSEENHRCAVSLGSIVLLENTRFHKEEKKGEEAFAQQLAELGDIYINDAFGSAHREHASTATVAKYFDADSKSFGFLMEKEIENANRVLNDPARPLNRYHWGSKSV